MTGRWSPVSDVRRQIRDTKGVSEKWKEDRYWQEFNVSINYYLKLKVYY
jgi:hypothetical protein